MMNSKLCLVTGGTSGIGEAIALGLAELGATVVVTGRNRKRGEVVLARIREKTGKDTSDLMLADFASLMEVRNLAGKFREKHDRLDVLVNNAGTWLRKNRTNEDGIEMTFAVNHLAHFLLTNLLLDILKKSGPSRIVNVSSVAHFGATFEFENLRGESSSKGYRAYGQSKLANILFTYELAERLKGTGVSVNCLHPGTIRTRLGRDYGILGALWRWFPLLRSAKKGAETAIYLATSPEVQGASGKYFMDKKEARSSPESYDVTLRKQLWKISAELTGLGNDR